MEGFEIERKFLMDQNCHVIGKQIHDGVSIQRYLSIDPEVRIRKDIDRDTGKVTYEMAFKGSGGLKRKELNIPIEECYYEALSNLVEGTPLIKFYKNFEVQDNKILTFSSVDPDLSQHFMYGEIEFYDEGAANSYIPDFEFIREVTDDQDYKMKNYWLRNHYTGVLEVNP